AAVCATAVQSRASAGTWGLGGGAPGFTPGAHSRSLKTNVDAHEGAGAAQVDLVAAEVLAHIGLGPEVAALGGDREVVVDRDAQPGHRVRAEGGALVDEVVADDVQVRVLEVDEVAELLVLVVHDVDATADVGRGAVPSAGHEAQRDAHGRGGELQGLVDRAAAGPLEVAVLGVEGAPVAVHVEAELHLPAQVERVL